MNSTGGFFKLYKMITSQWQAGSADWAHLNVEFVAVTKKLLTDLKQNEKNKKKQHFKLLYQLFYTFQPSY